MSSVPLGSGPGWPGFTASDILGSPDTMKGVMEQFMPPSKEDIFKRWDETNKQLKRIADALAAKKKRPTR